MPEGVQITKSNLIVISYGKTGVADKPGQNREGIQVIYVSGIHQLV